MKRNDSTRFSWRANVECAFCGSVSVSSEQTTESFEYAGDPVVTLTVSVPQYTCNDCNQSFLDASAEDRRHEAVCAHLGVLTPTQIRRLRESHGLSRAEFARLSKLGAATIARWERGSLIQNGANDLYLRLLQDPANIRRLQDLGSAEQQGQPYIYRCLKPGARDRDALSAFKLVYP
jgi:putative zinc finger/helix-turn-helix YgiT family protein